MFLYSGLISSLLRCRLLSISWGRELVVSLITLLQISRSSLSKDLILIFFSGEVISRSPNKNLPPLNCWFCPNCLSGGSLWNFEANTKSYSSPSKSSISNARQRRVLTSAEPVYAVSVTFSQLGILSVCHAWIHSAIAHRNDGFWSPLTAPLPGQLLVEIEILELDVTHHLLNNLMKKFRNSTVLLSSGKKID